MISRRGEVSARTRWWERWAAVLLVAALLIVGHDLLMTGNAHAASTVAAHDAPRHAPLELVPSLGDCGSAKRAARPSVVTVNGPCGPALYDQFAIGLISPLSNISDAPPTLPPRVRRALLQIYRV